MASQSMHRIEKELRGLLKEFVAGLHPKVNDDPVKFRTELARYYSSDMPEEVLQKLSEGAYDWCESAVVALAAEGVPSPFDPMAAASPDEIDEDEDEDESQGEGHGTTVIEEEEEVEPSDDVPEPAPKKKAKAKKAKPAPEPVDPSDTRDELQKLPKKSMDRRKMPRLKGNAHDQFLTLALKNWGKSRTAIYALSREAGINLTNGSMATTMYHLARFGEQLKKMHGIDVPRYDDKPVKPGRVKQKA